MDTRIAETIKVGDIVVYDGERRTVTAIVAEGLWAPYFELPEVGLISHRLIHSLQTQPERELVEARSG